MSEETRVQEAMDQVEREADRLVGAAFGGASEARSQLYNVERAVDALEKAEQEDRTCSVCGNGPPTTTCECDAP